MKNLDLKSALAGVLLTMLVVTFTIVATTERTPPAWEYKIVSGFRGKDFENAINNTAKDGWEVVAVSYPTESNPTPFAVMKKARTKLSHGWWMFWKK
jgi:Domain of unknown function (DUF4177)